MELNKNIFKEFEHQKVRYCHWKSNNHLDKALDGKTDLDLFVLEEDRKLLEIIVSDFGFVEIEGPKIKSTYKVCDYLGFDLISGKLSHLHIHYVIVLGEKYAKNYFLPLEKEFITNTSLKYEVVIPNSNLELLILMIRMHIKLDWFSLLTYLKYKKLFPKDIGKEFVSLNKVFNEKEFLSYCEKIFDVQYQKRILRIKDKLEKGNYSLIDTFRSKYFFKKLLQPYRREKGISFYFKKLYLSFRYFKYVQRIKKTKKKKLLNKSISIAFVGADGSGKSTITKDINKWLSWKLEVEGLYLGIPKKSLTIKSISLIRKIISKLFSVIGVKYKEKSNIFFAKIQWLIVGYKRKKIGRYITESSNKGKIFIIDRYPLPIFDQMTSPMDRPRISKIINKNNWLSAIEEKLYREIPQPDKIIVLQADIDTLRTRKTNTELNQHIEKANAVNSINTSEDVILIDATMPYEEVLLQVKVKIWEILNEFN